MEQLHNAQVSVELCRAILAQSNQHNAAARLRGVELLTQDDALFAHDILSRTRVYGRIAGTAKNVALQALSDAFSGFAACMA